MKPGNDILNELKAISPLLAEMEKVNVFSVPEGYFNYIPSTILLSLKNEIVAHNSSTVPEGYFDTLAENILQKIKSVPTNTNEDEIAKQSVLFGLNSTNVFQVPDNYFETLAETILAKATKQKAKIISMPLRRRLIKYAVAAVLTGTLALGVYTKYTGNSHHTNVSSTVMVASLAPAIERGKNMDEKQFNITLASLSEDDIAAYLEKNGNEKDVQTLESVIDENNLPSKDEYILDEKTLDKYLQDSVSIFRNQ